MLAKLRAASGRVSRSWLLTTPWCTALAVSIDSVVIEEALLRTFTVSRPLSGLRVTMISRTRLTATSTFALAWLKSLAVTVTR